MNGWEFAYKVFSDIGEFIGLVLSLIVVFFLTPPGWVVLYYLLK